MDSKAKGHFRIQLLLAYNTWSTPSIVPKNDRYSTWSTDLTLLSLINTVEKYGRKFIFDGVDTALADTVNFVVVIIISQ